MHLQAWDPYYFSPFGVETKLRNYLLVGARTFSPRYSLLFSIFCFKYTFHFFCVKLCLSRISFYFCSKPCWATPCGFFAVFLFPLSFTFQISLGSSILWLYLLNRILFFLSKIWIVFTQNKALKTSKPKYDFAV